MPRKGKVQFIDASSFWRKTQEPRREGRRSEPASIDATKVAALKAEGLGATEIAKRLGVGRASVYRLAEKRASPLAS